MASPDTFASPAAAEFEHVTEKNMASPDTFDTSGAAEFAQPTEELMDVKKWFFEGVSPSMRFPSLDDVVFKLLDIAGFSMSAIPVDSPATIEKWDATTNAMVSMYNSLARWTCFLLFFAIFAAFNFTTGQLIKKRLSPTTIPMIITLVWLITGDHFFVEAIARFDFVLRSGKLYRATMMAALLGDGKVWTFVSHHTRNFWTISKPVAFALFFYGSFLACDRFEDHAPKVMERLVGQVQHLVNEHVLPRLS